MEAAKIIALAGNPNVGKSTVFNGLTGMKQHTGNWPGKTVANARGYCSYKGQTYLLVDLPGAYSLAVRSAEEEIARDFLSSGQADAVVVVCDATCLERNLNLAMQIIQLGANVILCINLMDEAEKKGIHIDTALLSKRLGVPVTAITARDRKSLTNLMEIVHDATDTDRISKALSPELSKADAVSLVSAAEAICREAVSMDEADWKILDWKVDRILTGRFTGYPLMILLLAFLLWLTITGANYPSMLLADALFRIQDILSEFFMNHGIPLWIHDMLILGVYRTAAWVVSVMLPPMAIFFPLFTLLEDVGYLPRIAYNLDKPFQCCRACGKQALTMCMGFGCNAVGVTGCRIIDSPRERLLAILTNSFVPCNGKFPMLIMLSSIFFAGTLGGFSSSVLSVLMLTFVILLGIGITFAATKLLSATLLRGVPSSFTLELPPYRRPQICTTLVRSVFDRTLFVLGRAVAVAVPAGLIIWIMANVHVNGISLLSICASFLDPFAALMGLDGVILMAFILGFPANEIVMPIVLMAYLSQGSLMEAGSLSEMGTILRAHGWTWVTALNAMLFSLMHWPCSTTLLTIRKETGSLRWTAAAALLPAAAGVLLCMLFTGVCRLIFG